MPLINLSPGPRCALKAAPLLESKTKGHNLVYPLAFTSKKMLIVGEALGADEEINSKYFCGKAGFLFDKLLTDVGLIRSSIHVTNVVKIRPPDNKLARLEEYGLKIQDFIPFLKEEIECVKPTVILALGATALNALCEESGILKQRGSVLECTLVPGITVIPTLHPSYLQRGQMDLYPYVRHDIKIFAEIGFGFYQPEQEWEEIIDPTLTQILTYLNEILESSTQTCLDIETVAKQRITCIGFTKNPNSSICIPFRYKGLKLRWSEAEQTMILRSIQQIFQRGGLQKIGQNIHYDLHHLLPLVGFPREPTLDTRYAHQLIHPDMRHDLGFIISAYTKMNYHKDEVKDWSSKNLPKDHTLWSYNCKDVIGTHRAALGLIKDLKELDLYDFYCGYINPFRRVIFEMEHRGLNVDMNLHKEWKDYIEQEELPIALDIINKKCGQEINPNSSKQIGEYLTSLGINVPRTPKGNFTVKEETLEDLISKHPEHRFILKQILCARTLKAKDLGTYLSALISPDNHMKCSYGYTVTGRLTSSTDQFGHGCVLPGTQVLSKRGWVSIEDILPTDEIIQWDKDYSLSWTQAILYSTYYEGDLVTATSNLHKNTYTTRHRIPGFHPSHKTFSTKTAAERNVGGPFCLPISGQLKGENKLPYLRLVIAIQADGSIENGCIRIALKKANKISRLLKLFHDYHIDASEQNASIGYRRFSINAKQSKPIIEILTKSGYKTLGPWMFDLCLEDKLAIIDELKYWDAHIRGKSFWYFNTDKTSVESVHTLAHLCGFSASLYIEEDNWCGGYGTYKNKILYTVAIKPRKYTVQNWFHYDNHTKYKGMVYCLTTPTSFFMCKNKGQIVITGNTNLQNIPKHLKQIFIPEPGHVFLDADLSAAEARAMAFFMNSQKMKDVLNGPVKIHYIVGEWIFGKPYKELNAEEYLIAKKTVHGCVDDLTQVLTPKGWLYINELTKAHKIAQWNNETNKIDFTHPTEITTFKSDSNKYLIKSQYINQYMTPEHRMPHYQVCYGRGRIPCKGPVRDIQAKDFTPNRNSYKLPISGSYSNTEQLLTKNEMSLLVAIQADCCVRKAGDIDANFIKPYKIKRLVFLLDQLKIKYSIYPYLEKGRSFHIPRQQKLEKIKNHFGPGKTFKLEMLLLNNLETLKVFTKELGFWDGRVNELNESINSWQYYTTNKHNAEVAQTLAHLTNRRAILARRENQIGFGGPNNKTLYTVSISNYNKIDITSVRKSKIENHYPEYMYCPTVPTSYFLIKREGKISITGNSNYKMGVNLFSRIIGKPVHEARAIQEKYFTVVPELPQYHRDIQKEVENNRRITNPFGRTRIFTGKVGPTEIQSSYAQKPQSTIVDMMNFGILSLYLIKPNNIHLVTQTHDSVLCSLPPILYKWWSVFIKSHLEVLRRIEINGDIMNIPIEIDPPKTNWLGK